MIYLAIIALIIGLELSGGLFRFPINYEIYLGIIVENLIYVRNKLTPLAINIGYKLLYGLSLCQIQINKMAKLITPYVKDIKTYLKDKGFIEEVKLIIIDIIGKNGEVVNSLITRHDEKMPCQIDILKSYFDKENHIGILLHDKNEETNCVNKIFHEQIPSTADYKLSKINFMDIEIEYNGTKYRIILKNDTSNYYIVNNSLNKNFFKYYLNTVRKVPVYDYNFDYKVTIIDNCVNLITLSPDQYIIFNEDDYTILPILEPITIHTTETNDTPITEEQTSSESDKSSDDFVKLESEN